MKSLLSIIAFGTVFSIASAAAQPRGVVADVRAAINEKDLANAEKIVLSALASEGTTPDTIEALSWLGRGALGEQKLALAQTYAERTYAMVEEQLMTRQLDDEPRLPAALGAAIEVQAQILAAEGARSEAVLYLRQQIDRWKDTSIVTRLYKNLNLLSLEGQPALPLTFTEWIGPRPAPLEALKGRPVVLFLWAHWCPDCKAMGPVLEAAYRKYRDTGLTVVAPTQRFGYVAQRKPAPPDEELAYITSVRDQFYPWLKDVAVPVSREIYTTYGVSTTPTLVFVDRAGNVARYNPGRMTAEELDAALRAIVGPAPSAR